MVAILVRAGMCVEKLLWLTTQQINLYSFIQGVPGVRGLKGEKGKKVVVGVD